MRHAVPEIHPTEINDNQDMKIELVTIQSQIPALQHHSAAPTSSEFQLGDASDLNWYQPYYLDVWFNEGRSDQSELLLELLGHKPCPTTSANTSDDYAVVSRSDLLKFKASASTDNPPAELKHLHILSSILTTPNDDQRLTHDEPTLFTIHH